MPKTESTGTLLRIFVDEDDRWENQPLYTAIVEELRTLGFGGATVLKGIEGFGSHRQIHAARVFDFSTNMPILIEVLESEERIASLIPRLSEMVSEGLFTLEAVRLIRISKGGN